MSFNFKLRILKRLKKNIHIFKFLLIIMVFLISYTILFTGCRNQVDSLIDTNDTTEKSDILNENISISFKADGIISSNEYNKHKNFGEIDVYWSNDSNNIFIALKAKTTGFVAIGLQPGKTMKDADMVIGYVLDEKAIIFDMYSTGSFGPHKPDEELGGTNDILEFNGTESEGTTIIEFSRKLKTGDKYDIDINFRINKIIWAIGKSDNLDQKHITRGYGEIDI